MGLKRFFYKEGVKIRKNMRKEMKEGEIEKVKDRKIHELGKLKML